MNLANNFRFFGLMVLLLCSTIHAAHEPAKKVRLTVFVHGIMSIKPHISFSNFVRFMTDRVEDTMYSETVRYMRNDPFFFKNQAMQELGWHKIDKQRIEQGYASGLVARLYDEVEQLIDPCHQYDNHYYAFGWYGLLSARIRYHEAIPLYEALAQEVNNFRAQGIEPEVRVIGYSHGGNLCLNLGAVRQNTDLDQTLKIKELVLLGVPIQCETDFLLSDPLFEHVYQIYSRGDRIQKLDFFSTKRFFSRRMFKSRKYFQLPEKLTQIQVRMTRAVRSKHRKGLPCFNMDDLGVISGKSKHLRDMSPGHIELWFFSWTPTNYRQHFTLSPLPMMVFVPHILAQAKQTLCQTNAGPDAPIIMDIRPEFEQMIIKNQKSWRDTTTTHFFSQEILERMAEMTKPYVPENYSIEEYEYHIEMALDKAKTDCEQKCTHKGRMRRRTKRHEPQHRKPFITSTLVS